MVEKCSGLFLLLQTIPNYLGWLEGWDAATGSLKNKVGRGHVLHMERRAPVKEKGPAVSLFMFMVLAV